MSSKEHISNADESNAASIVMCELDYRSNPESLLHYLASREALPDKRLYDEKTDAQPFSSAEAISKGHVYTSCVDDERGSAVFSIKNHLRNPIACRNLHKYSKALLSSQTSIPLGLPYTHFDPPPRVRLSETRKNAWLQDLANDKICLSSLSKKIPHGVWGKDIIQLVLDFRVPLPRAVWFIRCAGINEIRSYFKKYPCNSPKDWVFLWTDVIGDFLIDFFSNNQSKDDIQTFSGNFVYVNRLFGRLLTENLIVPSLFIAKVISLISDLPLYTCPSVITFLDYFSLIIIRDTSITRNCVLGLLPVLSKFNESPSIDLNIKRKVLSKAAEFLYRLASSNNSGFYFPNEWEDLYPVLSIIWKPNKTHDSLLSIVNDLNIRAICMVDASTTPVRFMQTLSNFKPSLNAYSFAKKILHYSYTESITFFLRWSIHSKNRTPEHRFCIFLSVLHFYKADHKLATNIILNYLFQVSSISNEESFIIAQLLNYLSLEGYFMFSGYVARLAALGYLRESMLMADFMDVQRKIILHLPLFQFSRQVRSKLNYILVRGSFIVDYDQCNTYVEQFQKNPSSFAFKKGESFSIIVYTLLKSFSICDDSVYRIYMALFNMYHYCMLKEFFDCVVYALNKPHIRASALLLLVKAFPNIVMDKRITDRIEMLKPENVIETYLLHEIKHLYQLDFDVASGSAEDESLCKQIQDLGESELFFKGVFGDDFHSFKALVCLYEEFFKIDDNTLLFSLTNSLLILKKHLGLSKNFNDVKCDVADLLQYKHANYSEFIVKLLRLYGNNILTVGDLWIILNRLLKTYEEDMKGHIVDIFMGAIFVDERDSEKDHLFYCLLWDAKSSDVGLEFLKFLIQYCSKNELTLRCIWNILRSLNFHEIIQVVPEKWLLRTIMEKYLSFPFHGMINESLIKHIFELDEFVTQLFAAWLTTLTKEELSDISEDVMENILTAGLTEKGLQSWHVICLGLPSTKQIFQRILLYSVNKDLDLPSHFLPFLSTITEYIVHEGPDKLFLEQLKTRLRSLFFTLKEQVLSAEIENDSLTSRIRRFSNIILQFHKYLEADEYANFLRILSAKKYIYKNQSLFESIAFVIDKVKTQPVNEDETFRSFHSWTNIECRSLSSDLPEALKEFHPRKTVIEPSIW
ncbi:mediator complex subunit Srb8 [Schizosaccharomyces cryophilus OY26]|uniref:Mediator of RNA polymerase II transcription subunit 12 n=1 Tax=Schizosaccharomyces cryophilus (strain OY26 / ATCC MYA-4695 / CBS 11777 / NBRC 106824 / NRRL Y48691) TaxID=653667 RepID=S9W4D9_SCHCR|nr:mediator complex subunit Srb8 [Schizosaccharomyces cryophilus OY26]EPY53369.1 mediator complex subunit Srb8 [Schizosaccharomyces cryophilus OY26]